MKTRDLTQREFDAACTRRRFLRQAWAASYYDVGRGFCVSIRNAAPTRRAQLAYLIRQSERAAERDSADDFHFQDRVVRKKGEKKMETYYAVRRGFGREGHGKAIVEWCGEAASADDAERELYAVLQQQFGGLADGKIGDCGIAGSIERAAELCGAEIE